MLSRVARSLWQQGRYNATSSAAQGSRSVRSFGSARVKCQNLGTLAPPSHLDELLAFFEDHEQHERKDSKGVRNADASSLEPNWDAPLVDFKLTKSFSPAELLRSTTAQNEKSPQAGAYGIRTSLDTDSVHSEDVPDWRRALAALPALDSFLDNTPTMDEIIGFLNSNDVTESLDPSHRSPKKSEWQGLVRSVEQVAKMEFAGHNYAGSAGGFMKPGSTLRLLRYYQQIGFCTEQVWTSALRKSSSTFYAGCLSHHSREGEVGDLSMASLDGFNIKSLHGFGAQVDALLRLWREAFQLRKVCGPTDTTVNPWLLQRSKSEHSSPPDTFHDAVCQVMGDWVSSCDAAMKIDISCAALLTSFTVLIARSLQRLPQSQRLQQGTRAFEQIANLSEQTLTDFMGDFEPHEDDLGFLSWIFGAFALVRPNIMTTKLSMASMSMSREETSQLEWFLQVLPRLVPYLPRHKAAEMTSRAKWRQDTEHLVRHVGRFDHMIAAQIQAAKHHWSQASNLQDMYSWISLVDRTYHDTYDQHKLYDAIASAPESFEMAHEREIFLQERIAIKTHWRKILSKRIRFLASAYNPTALDRLWIFLLRLPAAETWQFAHVWYYQLLKAHARVGSRSLWHCVSKIHMGDLGISPKRTRRILNHALRITASSDPELTKRVFQRFKKVGVGVDSQTALWMLRYAIRFERLATARSWLRRYRQESADDRPIRHDMSTMLERGLQELFYNQRTDQPYKVAEFHPRLTALVAYVSLTVHRGIDTVDGRALLLLKRRKRRRWQEVTHSSELLLTAGEVCLQLQRLSDRWHGAEGYDTLVAFPGEYLSNLAIALQKQSIVHSTKFKSVVLEKVRAQQPPSIANLMRLPARNGD